MADYQIDFSKSPMHDLKRGIANLNSPTANGSEINRIANDVINRGSYGNRLGITTGRSGTRRLLDDAYLGLGLNESNLEDYLTQLRDDAYGSGPIGGLAKGWSDAANWVSDKIYGLGNTIDSGFDKLVNPDGSDEGFGATIANAISGDQLGTGLNMLFDFIPGLGSAKIIGESMDDLAGALSGKNLATGEDLEDGQGFLKGAGAALNMALGAIPGVGQLGRVGKGVSNLAKGTRDATILRNPGARALGKSVEDARNIGKDAYTAERKKVLTDQRTALNKAQKEASDNLTAKLNNHRSNPAQTYKQVQRDIDDQLRVLNGDIKTAGSIKKAENDLHAVEGRLAKLQPTDPNYQNVEALVNGRRADLAQLKADHQTLTQAKADLADLKRKSDDAIAAAKKSDEDVISDYLAGNPNSPLAGYGTGVNATGAEFTSGGLTGGNQVIKTPKDILTGIPDAMRSALRLPDKQAYAKARALGESPLKAMQTARGAGAPAGVGDWNSYLNSFANGRAITPWDIEMAMKHPEVYESMVGGRSAVEAAAKTDDIARQKLAQLTSRDSARQAAKSQLDKADAALQSQTGRRARAAIEKQKAEAEKFLAEPTIADKAKELTSSPVQSLLKAAAAGGAGIGNMALNAAGNGVSMDELFSGIMQEHGGSMAGAGGGAIPGLIALYMMGKRPAGAMRASTATRMMRPIAELGAAGSNYNNWNAEDRKYTPSTMREALQSLLSQSE